MEWSGGGVLLVRLPWERQRSPPRFGGICSCWTVFFLLSSLFPFFQFLLEMEGAATGAELGLFHCLLCAWETPSRLAVLQHLRAPAHRDAQAQRHLQLLQSGLAAEEGLSALQSILSFSHGQHRTPGENQETRGEGLDRESSWHGSQGSDEQVIPGRRHQSVGPQ